METGKNTLRCQRCGTVLEARRLRILYSSEQLDDAVTFRTRLQAEISGTGSEKQDQLMMNPFFPYFL